MKDFKQILRTIWLLLISVPVIIAFSYQIHLLLEESPKADLLMFAWLFVAIIVICLQWGWHIHKVLFKKPID
jgi:uncharacterized membrane protein YoaK (UPF0700 family)